MTGSDRDDARPEQRKGQDGNVFWDLAAPEVGLMSCSWLYFESRTTPQRFCDRPGHPYCEEYQREMDAGFLTVNLISPRFNSNPAFLRARRIQRGRKTRTLHKNGEECGTRKFNPPPKHGPLASTWLAIIGTRCGGPSETTSASGECGRSFHPRLSANPKRGTVPGHQPRRSRTGGGRPQRLRDHGNRSEPRPKDCGILP